MANQAADRAHDVVERAADKIKPTVNKITDAAHQAIDRVADKAGPAAEWAQDKAELRERPGAALRRPVRHDGARPSGHDARRGRRGRLPDRAGHALKRKVVAAPRPPESSSDRSDHFDGRGDGTPRRNRMNFLIWIVVGGLLGWLASKMMNTDAQQGVMLNIVVGIVGALLAGFLLAPLFGVGTINTGDFSAPGLLISLLGAVILLAIVNLVRRGAPR